MSQVRCPVGRFLIFALQSVPAGVIYETIMIAREKGEHTSWICFNLNVIASGEEIDVMLGKKDASLDWCDWWSLLIMGHDFNLMSFKLNFMLQFSFVYRLRRCTVFHNCEIPFF